jgi:hypothetical protein
MRIDAPVIYAPTDKQTRIAAHACVTDGDYLLCAWIGA